MPKIIIFISFIFAASFSHAENLSIDLLSQKFTHKDLEIHVTVKNLGSFADPLDIDLSIRSLKNDTTITLREIDIISGKGMSDVFNQSNACAFVAANIKISSEAIKKNCILIPNYEINNFKKIISKALENLKYGDFIIKLKTIEDEKIDIPLTIKFKPAYITIIIGALIGSLLMALLQLAFKHAAVSFDDNIKETITPITTKKNFSFISTIKNKIYSSFGFIIINLSFIFWRLIIGVVVSIIIIALTKTSNTSGLPISININDIWGGVVIGLGALPLGQFIKGKFDTNHANQV